MPWHPPVAYSEMPRTVGDAVSTIAKVEYIKGAESEQEEWTNTSDRSGE